MSYTRKSASQRFQTMRGIIGSEINDTIELVNTCEKREKRKKKTLQCPWRRVLSTRDEIEWKMKDKKKIHLLLVIPFMSHPSISKDSETWPVKKSSLIFFFFSLPSKLIVTLYIAYYYELHHLLQSIFNIKKKKKVSEKKNTIILENNSTESFKTRKNKKESLYSSEILMLRKKNKNRNEKRKKSLFF